MSGRPRIDPEIASRLHLAAIVGVPCLASELEELGISDPDESLGDAQELRVMILQEVDNLRREQG